MRKKMLVALTVICALALFAGRSNAGTVNFNFKIPAIPWPPLVSEVIASAAVEGAPDFKVVAKIAAQTQKTPTCDKANQADCVSTDWYLKDSPGITPNPPAIKMAKVYYYLNDQAASAASVSMVEDPTSGENKWKATVPIPAGAKQGDTVTYYIVAVDGRGNVVSQVPDTGTVNATCPSSPASWNAVFSTPSTSSCSYATSYTQCNVLVNGTPSCGTSYALNDKNGDVCGEPNGNGDQSVVSVPKTDITGMSAAADKDYLCINYGLGASPPDANDPSPIEGYLVIMFNPDMPDDNPADFQIKNAFAITYAPEVTATDPTLVRVLWDADCITDPNTANILDCKLIYVTGTDTKLQIGYNSGLKFIVKRSGTGNPLAKSYSLIGNTNKIAYLVGLTGEINLSGANAFWIADLTPGLSFYQKNQSAPIVLAPPPSPPPLGATKCSVDGSSGTTSACPKSLSKPAQNRCKLSWYDSLDKSFVTNYKIYKGTSPTYTAGVTTLVTTVGSSTLTYTDEIAQGSLTGAKYYYFISSYNSSSSDETKKESPSASIGENVTICTVEDWVAPAAPTMTKAATPAGNEKKCKLDFTMPPGDPSLKSFYMTRNNVPLNFTSQKGAVDGVTSYDWTDPDTLTLNTAYSYKVTATDIGDNIAVSTEINCTPEDLKAPSGVTTAIAANLQGKLGVHLDWTASEEEDLAGYYVYWCKMNNSAIDCRTSESFAKMSTSMESPSAINFENFTPAIFDSASDYCFYVEPCDNCDTAGNCPSNTGKPNCSGFPSGGADAKTWVKCLPIDVIPDPLVPAFPSGVAASAPSEGRKCKISWSKNYKNSDNSAFEGGSNPLPKDLTGYKIMRNTVAGVPTPAQATHIGMVGVGGTFNETYTDTSVINGQTYYYAVYAVDGSANFSANGAGGSVAEVQCSPNDTIAPNIPVMGTPGYTQISCTPKWTAVSDPDTLSYSVYKCQGGSSTCNATGTFAVDADCAMEVDGVSCTDNTLNVDQEYTFCVTAADPVPNTSATFPAAAIRTNCASCTPSARPQPATGTVAIASGDKLSTKIYWSNSSDYDQVSGGINIYRCTDTACATKTKAKACASLLASSNEVKNISFTNQYTIAAEPAGTWYYGVTYQKDCSDTTTESSLVGTAITTESVTIEITTPECTVNCVVISSCAAGKCTPLTELDASTYINGAGTTLDKQVGRATPKQGVAIYLLKNDGTFVAGPVLTDADGNFEFNIDNAAGDVKFTDKFQVVIKIAEADKAGIPCSDPTGFGSFKTTLGSDCGIQVIKNLVLKAATPAKVSLVNIPKGGQGRSEIGNINCDNVVDMKDYALFKKNYDKDVTADPTAAPMDINQDGVVDSKDFVIFKKNFNRCISGSFDADGNCLSAAPSKITGLCK